MDQKMQQISRQRFDALAGYCRQPQIVLYTEELAWFEYDNGRFLGVLIRDRIDSDFSCVVVARDERGRYRFITGTISEETQFAALKKLEHLFEKEAKEPPAAHFQGDEKGKKLDLFKVIANNPAPDFLKLANDPSYSPARELIEAMIYYFDDPDNNFVKDFQSTGFDGRLWELYLFAAFHEQGFAFDRDKPVPDYSLRGLRGKFFVEAVTVNPTIDKATGKNLETGLPVDEKLKAEYLKNYIPIKYGSPLATKLSKKYWEHNHVAGNPLVLAIQDCHYPNSTVWSERELPSYLYGQTFSKFLDHAGAEVRRPVKITEHKWLTKVIPSGYFLQPDAENISAVLTSTQGNIDKFNRMGILAGFGKRLKHVVRYGTALVRVNYKYAIRHFAEDACSSSYAESWSGGMNVYHNPKALHPLNPELLPQAAHFFLNGDEVANLLPDAHVLNSVTNYGVPLEKMREQLQNATATVTNKL